MDVLILCTGNICRSPMAEAFLRRRLEDLGVEANVHSAGLLSNGRPVPVEGLDAVKALGLDASAHRSRRMTAEMVRQADLVICMAREHLREAALLAPDAWPRCFTLKELVRRGESSGPREPGQPFDEWLAKLHAARSRSEALGSSSDDDVADPIGGTRSVYQRTAGELSDLVERFASLAWGAELGWRAEGRQQ